MRGIPEWNKPPEPVGSSAFNRLQLVAASLLVVRRQAKLSTEMTNWQQKTGSANGTTPFIASVGAVATLRSSHVPVHVV